MEKFASLLSLLARCFSSLFNSFSFTNSPNLAFIGGSCCEQRASTGGSASGSSGGSRGFGSVGGSVGGRYLGSSGSPDFYIDAQPYFGRNYGASSGASFGGSRDFSRLMRVLGGVFGRFGFGRCYGRNEGFVFFGGVVFLVGLLLVGNAEGAITINGYSFDGEVVRIINKNNNLADCTVNNNCFKCNDEDNEVCTITGTTITQRLLIDPGVEVTFQDLMIKHTNHPAVTICNTAIDHISRLEISHSNNNGTVSLLDHVCVKLTTTTKALDTKITLSGINNLIVGLSGAALRVPSNAGVIIEGSGTLIAVGGAQSPNSCADAGAGIGGGKSGLLAVTNCSDGTIGTISNNPGTGNARVSLEDNCGTVTINGGTINAYGGGEGNNADKNTEAMCTFAAGIGGSGNRGGACNLTINGGNVKAVGGKSGANDIGPGLRYVRNGSSCYNYLNVSSGSTTGHISASSTAMINGGSVEAFIYNGNSSSSGNNYPVKNSANAKIKNKNGQELSTNLKTYTIGINNNETRDKPVVACTFTSELSETIACQSVLTNYGEPGDGVYGLMDVKTDMTKNVYFWLPSDEYCPESIKLDFLSSEKIYTPLSSSSNSATFKGPEPFMSLSSASQNSIVGSHVGENVGTNLINEPIIATSTGHYKTGFQMIGSQDVAAVGRKITMFKGNYIPNDAGTEAAGSGSFHSVQWWRADDLNSTGAQITQGLIDNENIIHIGKTSAEYKPSASDYGKYIWAKVIVRDSKNIGSKVFEYPRIKVGVVVNPEVEKHSSVNSYQEWFNITQRSVSIRDDGLVTDFITNLTGENADAVYDLSATAGVSGNDVPEILGYEWKVYLKDDENMSPLGNLINADRSPATYRLPGSGVSGDITLKVIVKNGSAPQLSGIKIVKENEVFVEYSPDNCSSNSRCNEGKIINGNFDIGNKRIPENGTITLYFNSQLTNVTAQSESDPIGRVYFQAQENNVIGVGNVNDAKELKYNYSGLTAGTLYSLVVSGFKNNVGNSMAQFNTSMRVERKPYIDEEDFKYDLKDYEFILGAEDLGASFTYVDGDGGCIVKKNGNDGECVKNDNDEEEMTKTFCYYWQNSTAATDDPPADGAAGGGFEQNGYECNNTTELLDFDPAKGIGLGEIRTSKRTLPKDSLGYWTRLVVRPTGNKFINGGTEGEPYYGDWKRIGVLLKAGGVAEFGEKDCVTNISTGAKGKCSLASDINFDGCDPSKASKTDEARNCYRDIGYMIFDKSQEAGVKLSAISKDYWVLNDMSQEMSADNKLKKIYNQINGWRTKKSDVNGPKCPTTDGFACGQVSTYTHGSSEDGTVVIYPVVEPASPPKVQSITLAAVRYTGATRSIVEADLKIKNDRDSIAVLENALPATDDGKDDPNNYLTVTFDQDVKGSTGTIEFVYGGNTPVPIDVENSCVFSEDDDVVGESDPLINSCKVKLDFAERPSGIDLFGTRYTVMVSGFKNRQNEPLQRETFSFVTASGPSVAKPSLSSDLVGKFAVGHEITYASSDFRLNGAIGVEGYSYKWERRNKDNGVESTIAGATSNKYSAVGDDFGHYIRLVVTPKAGTHEGAEIASDWVQIGVLLKMVDNADDPALASLVTNGNTSATHEVKVGGNLIASGIKGSFNYLAGEVVYGATPVNWSSSIGTDRVDTWTFTDGLPLSANTPVLTFTPSSPSGDITIKLKIQDGEIPAIFAQKNTTDDGILLEFSKGNNKIYITPTNNGKKITITRTVGGVSTYWDYIIGGEKCTLVQPTSPSYSYEIKFDCFEKRESAPVAYNYSLSENLDVLSVDPDAFSDGIGNLTRGGNLATLTSGSFYAITLNKYSFQGPNNIDYGNYVAVSIGIIEITNKSTSAVSLTATSKPDADSKRNTTIFTLDNCDLSSITANSGTANCEIKVNSTDLPAGTYKETLIIEDSDIPHKISQEVVLVFTVNKYALEIADAKKAKFVDDDGSIEYSDSKEFPQNRIDWKWEWIRPAHISEEAEAIVTHSSGEFSDPNVGDKPLIVTYTIGDDYKDNYVFKNTGTFTDTSPLQGSITQKELTLVVPDEWESLGNRDYNASNTVTLPNGSFTLEAKNAHSKNAELIAKVEANTANATIYLDSYDAGDASIESIVGLSLILKDVTPVTAATNYKLTIPSDLTKYGYVIDKVHIADLKKGDGYCNGEVTETCDVNKVTAVATYGQYLENFQSWDSIPQVKVGTKYIDVRKGSVSLSGSWRMCYGDSDEPGGNCSKADVKKYADKKDIDDIETNTEDYYAYFALSGRASDNYYSDLFVPVSLKVKKRALTIAANLNGAGDIGKGVKTYDGEKTLKGVKASSGDSNLFGDDSLGDLDAASAEFEDANAGNNKLLTVTWNLGGTDANKKYIPGETKTVGTIAKRNVNLLGFNGGETYFKYYDGTENVGVVNYDDLVAETQAEAKAKVIAEVKAQAIKDGKTEAEADAIAEAKADSIAKVTEFIGVIAGDVDPALVKPKADDGLTFRFSNSYAGIGKEIYPANGTITLDGTKKDNYNLILFSLKGDILPASLAYVWCKDEPDCPLIISDAAKNDTALHNKWLKDNIDHVAAKLISTGDSYLDGIYGDSLRTIQYKIAAVMPNTLNALFGATAKDPFQNEVADNSPITWAWKDTLIVDVVDGNGDVVGQKTIKQDSVKIGGVGLAPTNGKAIFVHGNSNYESGISIPIPVVATAKQLTATLVPQDKDYDTTNVVNILVIPGGKVSSNDDVSLIATGIADNPNAGSGKSVLVLENIIRWASGVDAQTKLNYLLPVIGKHTSPSVDDLTVSINKIPWPDAVKPAASENSFVYDTGKYPNLASIGLTPGWSWENADIAFPNPNDRLVNTKNDPALTRTYPILFAPPADMASNYMDASDNITLTIRKRSEDNSVASEGISNSVCGSETANITVTAKDEFATVWFNETQYQDSDVTPNKGTFRVGGLTYGVNVIPYSVQAQAYGSNFRASYEYPIERFIPFSKVATWVRNKSLTISLDSTGNEDRDFFRSLGNPPFDFAETKWYQGKELIGTGRSLPWTKTAEVDEYSVILKANPLSGGRLYTSCKENGGLPDVVPIVPETGRKVNLIASAFGSRIVAGGTTLTLNTPYGGAVSIYTMKGELVSRMNAVDSRTVVRIPSAKGMYIVKLEAK